MESDPVQVYILLHHEIFFLGNDLYVDDEMVFSIYSSFESAMKYIKDVSRVSTYSWWEIQKACLNDWVWPEHIGYYGRKGGELKNPPFNKCVEYYKKEHKNV